MVETNVYEYEIYINNIQEIKYSPLSPSPVWQQKVLPKAFFIFEHMFDDVLSFLFKSEKYLPGAETLKQIYL